MPLFNTMHRINCSADCLYVVWPAFNHIVQLLSAYVTHAAGNILLAILTQCFKDYFECACDVFIHIPVSGFDYRTSPLFRDTRGHSWQASGSNYRRRSPTSLLRRSQCTHPPNSNGPTALPLQNKEGLHQNVFMAGRLSGCLHAARRRSPRPSTI